MSCFFNNLRMLFTYHPYLYPIFFLFFSVFIEFAREIDTPFLHYSFLYVLTLTTFVIILLLSMWELAVAAKKAARADYLDPDVTPLARSLINMRIVFFSLLPGRSDGSYYMHAVYVRARAKSVFYFLTFIGGLFVVYSFYYGAVPVEHWPRHASSIFAFVSCGILAEGLCSILRVTIWFLLKKDGVIPTAAAARGHYETPSEPTPLDLEGHKLFREHRIWLFSTPSLLRFFRIVPTLNNYILFSIRLFCYSIFILACMLFLKIDNIPVWQLICKVAFDIGELTSCKALFEAGLYPLALAMFIWRCFLTACLFLPPALVISCIYHSWEILVAATLLQRVAQLYHSDHKHLSSHLSNHRGWSLYLTRCCSWRRPKLFGCRGFFERKC